MPRNSSKHLIIAQRRDAVSRYRNRGATLLEIMAALPGPPYNVKNPETGQPWSYGTIQADVKRLEQESIERAAKSADEKRARQVDELKEARRRAWEQDDMEEVRLNVESEAKLEGTMAPAKVAPTTPDGSEAWKPVTDDERAAIQSAIFARLGLGQPGQSPARGTNPDGTDAMAESLPGDGAERDAGGPVATGAAPVLGAEADNLL